MGTGWRRALLLASVAVTLVASGCSTKETGGGDSRSAVGATLKDFEITLDQTSVSSGKVTFTLKNDGPSEHEFVVLRTDDAADALPIEDGQATEDAEGVTNVGEKEDIAPGGTASLSLDLPPGSYVLICNITGHYQQGMRTSLTVG